MRRLLLLLCLLAPAVVHATEFWQDDTDASSFKLYNLPAPAGLGTAALRLQDVAVGACGIWSVGVNSTFRCGVDGTDYLSPATGVRGPLPADTQVLYSVGGTSIGGDSGLRHFANGSLGIGFDPSVTNLDFPGLPGDTAGLNVFNPSGSLRNHFAGWLNNNAGNPVAAWVGHGSLSTTTAGNETGGMTYEVLSSGNLVVAQSVNGTVGGNVQVKNSAGTVANPGYSWLADGASGFYLTGGVGPDFDLHYAVFGVRSYDWTETGTVGNLSHYIRAHASGTGQGGFLVSPNLQTGLMYDPVSGGAYVDANSSSFAIGAPGAQATNATSGFLGLNSMAGVPSGTPANTVSGKKSITLDTTDDRLYGFNSSWRPYGQYDNFTGPVCSTVTTGVHAVCGSGSITCAMLPALTGDVTTSAGSCGTTLANIPNATPAAGDILFTAIAAPSTPAAGKAACYVDSTSKNVACKNDAGTVNHGVQTVAAVSHKFVTAINDAGLPSLGQPDASDLTGWPTVSQILVSSGTTTAPIGDPLFTWNAASDEQLVIGTSAFQGWYNVTGTNYERVSASWSGNVWSLKSEKGGTGTIRAMKLTSTAGVTVDEYLQVNGPTANNNVSLVTGHTTNSTRDRVQFFVGGGTTLDTDNTYVDVSATSTAIPNGSTIAKFATTRIRPTSFTSVTPGTLTITNARFASLYIDDKPTLDAGLTALAMPNFAIYVGGKDTTYSALDSSLKVGGIVTASENAFIAQAGNTGTATLPKIGFFNPAVLNSQFTVVGSRGGNAALASLLSSLAGYGLIVDSSTP